MPGAAAGLSVETYPQDAIAGGSSFGTQPALALRDLANRTKART